MFRTRFEALVAHETPRANRAAALGLAVLGLLAGVFTPSLAEACQRFCGGNEQAVCMGMNDCPGHANGSLYCAEGNTYNGWTTRCNGPTPPDCACGHDHEVPCFGVSSFQCPDGCRSGLHFDASSFQCRTTCVPPHQHGRDDSLSCNSFSSPGCGEAGDRPCLEGAACAPGLVLVAGGLRCDFPVECASAPPVATTAAPGTRDLTFLVATDLHVGSEENRLADIKHTVSMMNSIGHIDLVWPQTFSSASAGQPVAPPIALVTTGDLTHSQFWWDLGLFETWYEKSPSRPDALHFPHYAGLGNHDLHSTNLGLVPEVTRADMLGYLDRRMLGCGLIQPGNYHRGSQGTTALGGTYWNGSRNYSWDWQGVHLVQLHDWAGGPHGTIRGTSRQGGLAWLQQDLANNAGKPVLIFQHYGDTDYWHEPERAAFRDALGNADVRAIFVGHAHDAKMDSFHGIPMYQGSHGGSEIGARRGFFIVHMTDTALDVGQVTWRGHGGTTLSWNPDFGADPKPELPKVFAATIKNSSRTGGAVDECLMYYGPGASEAPSRFLWQNGDNGICGFSSSGQLLHNNQAVFKFVNVGDDLYTIQSALTQECLMFYGTAQFETPSRYLWGHGNNGFCGFASKEELVANKQAVFKVKVRDGNKVTIQHTLTNGCLTFVGNGYAASVTRHLWNDVDNGSCGLANEDQLLDNRQAVFTLDIFEDYTEPPAPAEPLPEVFTATLSNSSREHLQDECLMFYGGSASESPSRYHWGHSGPCGFPTKAWLLSNKQATWKLTRVGEDLYTIANALGDGHTNQCLMFYGTPQFETPKRYNGGHGDNGHCGFTSRSELLANKQAVWKIKPLGGKKYTIQHALTNQCLTFIGNGGATNPTRHLWNDVDNGYCGWGSWHDLVMNGQAVFTIDVQETLRADGDGDDAPFQLYNAPSPTSSATCLSVEGGATWEHAEALQATCNAGRSENLWTWMGAGEWRMLRNVMAGTCLSVRDASSEPNAETWMDACDASDDGRLWKWDGLELRSKVGTCLNVVGGSTAPGTDTHQYICDQSNGANTWSVKAVAFQLRNDQGATCLTVTGGNYGDARQAVCNDSPALGNLWGWVGTGEWRMLRNTYTATCLTVQGASSAVGAETLLGSCDPSNDANLWKWDQMQLRSKVGTCLNVEGGSAAPGANTHQFICDANNPANRWASIF